MIHNGLFLIMKASFAAVAAISAFAFCTRRVDGNRGEERFRELDSLLTELFPEGEPGAAVLVMEGDSVVYDKGFGVAILGDQATAISGETSFNIASCSKQFTSAAILQLACKGLLDLDSSIAALFPEYSNSIWERVTVRHLLSHSSGVPDKRGYLTREQKIHGDEELALEYLTSLTELNFEPGTAYEYINPTYVLLGKLVERISGMEFTEYVKRNIFTPAGMNRTLYFDRDHQELIPSMAHGYEYEDVSTMPEERTASSVSGTSVKNWFEYDFGEETFFATRPDGGIYTSTREFAKWERALRSGKILSEKMLEEAWTPHTQVSGSPFSDYQNRPNTWYGYGWFIEPATAYSPLVIYHTGDNGGFKILAARYPQSSTLVLVFANRADWDRYAVKTRIEEILGLRHPLG
jgi:Beta-lactamase class C and other penicillin binding proteins